MATGRITRLHKQDGYGFVQEEGGSEEFYFHWSSVTAGALDQLAVGQAVRFDLEPDPRDPPRRRAIRLQLLSG